MIPALLLLFSCKDSSKLAVNDTYQLVWADEFSSNGKPDTTKWRYEQGFVRNEELQWYQPDNAWCENGKMIIEARKEIKPNPV